MCFFSDVVDLNTKILLTWGMNDRPHMCLIDKKTKQTQLFNRVKNDSGMPFLTTSGEYLIKFDS